MNEWMNGQGCIYDFAQGGVGKIAVSAYQGRASATCCTLQYI